MKQTNVSSIGTQPFLRKGIGAPESHHGEGAVKALALLVLLSFVLMMSGPVGAADYVVVVDVSGSMRERVSAKDKRVRIRVVQEALDQYLTALPWTSRACLVSFNSGIVSEKEVILRDEQSLAEALAWSKALEKETLSNRQTHLWTTLRRALQFATRYSTENPHQPVTVRALTDGLDNEGVTTLDRVLAEFPLVDGEHIRGNLILLGDLELKTHFSLPPGAFEMTKNPYWHDLFPPVVLWFPTEPRTGEKVRMVENTRAIYATHQWQIDGAEVSTDKVLSWTFQEARPHRVTLRVTGLHGTTNSTTEVIRVRQEVPMVLDFVSSQDAAQPGQEIRFLARNSGQVIGLAWFLDGHSVATGSEFTRRFEREGHHEVRLEGWDNRSNRVTQSRSFVVREAPLSARITAPKEVTAGEPIQFASEVEGPATEFEWRFSDGTTSHDRNPAHAFAVEEGEVKEFQAVLRVVSPAGRVAEAPPHRIRVTAATRILPPQAAFRVLERSPRAGQVLRLVDETQGYVQRWKWTVTGESGADSKNPEILLTAPGKKEITLEVTGPGGASRTAQQITVTPQYEVVEVRSSATPSRGKAPLNVQFTGQIRGMVKSVRWDFGDGAFSTNGNPKHVYKSATNVTAVLRAVPVDPAQETVEARVVIDVIKPWPLWAKGVCVVCVMSALGGGAVFLLGRQQKQRLRLPVHFWVEDSAVCQTIELTKVAERRHLTSRIPIEVRRLGGTSTLVVESVEGASLMTADGKEVGFLNIGDGARIVVQRKSGPPKAVAISSRQKPRRPTPAISPTDSLETEAVLPGGGGEDFDWGWDGKPNHRD